MEAVLARIAIVMVALERDRTRQAPHRALPVARLHGDPLAAPRTRLRGRLFRLHPRKHHRDRRLCCLALQLLRGELHLAHRHALAEALVRVAAGELLEEILLRELLQRSFESPAELTQPRSATEEIPQGGRAPDTERCRLNVIELYLRSSGGVRAGSVERSLVDRLFRGASHRSSPGN